MMSQNLHFAKDFFNQAEKRQQFFEFTPVALYGASFKEWYERGFYEPHYIPYAFFSEDQLVANVSITKLDVWLQGQLIPAIQFATVGTRPEYRKQGLSRILMHKVFEDFAEENPLYFLFANDSVLDFYPKFGFRLVEEKIFEAPMPSVDSDFSARQLNLQEPEDVLIIKRLLQSRSPLSQLFGANNYELIFWWHALYMLPNCIWYLEALDTLVICQLEGEILEIYDLVFEQKPPFAKVLAQLLHQQTQASKIHFYFTPERLDIDYQVIAYASDSPLFVKGDFPLEQAFKFPGLAQT